jgi:hypothetical protein
LSSTLLGAAVGFVSFTGYRTASEWIGGASLGKAIVGLRVRSENLAPCTFRSALLRTLALVVDGLFFGAVAYAAMSSSARRQRYGDRWGGTVVIYATSLPKSTDRRRVAAGVAVSLAVAAILATAGTACLEQIFTREALAAAPDPSSVPLTKRGTLPNGLLAFHYPDDFAAKPIDDASALVTRPAPGGGPEGVVFIAVPRPFSKEPEPLGRVLAKAVERDIVARGGTMLSEESRATSCPGGQSGFEIKSRYRVIVGGNFISWSCSFIEHGHGYNVRYFLSDGPAKRDLPLLERIAGAADLSAGKGGEL